MSHLRRSPWWVWTLIVLLPLVIYGPFVFGGKVLFWGTPLLQFWPWRQLAAEQLTSGQVPLWNPYSGSGVPLLADHQSAVFYPGNLIFWILPVERAMGFSLVLHAIVAGLAMYALARELQLSHLGGLVAALAFMLSGYMVARGSFLTEISALTWLPLLWLYGRRAVRRRALGDVATLAAVVALQFLAGHAQTWFYSLISLGLYGLWEGIGTSRRASEPASGQSAPPKARAGLLPAALRPSANRVLHHVLSFLPLVCGIGWGVALAAVQFLPTFELSRLAGRAGREGWEEFALQYSFWPWRLITLLLPDFFGNPARGDYWGYATYWEDAGYIGTLPFVLALLAIVSWMHKRRRVSLASSALAQVPFFAILALFSLLMALGKNTPVYMFFFRHIPVFGSFQAPARWLCIYTPAVALLAGIGLDVLRPSSRLTFVCRLGVAGAAAAALTTWAAKGILPDVKSTFFDPLIQFALLFAASMLLMLWGQDAQEGKSLHIDRLRLGAPVWQALTILVVAVDLVFAGYPLNPAADTGLYAPQTRIGRFLTADGPQGRTFYLTEGREQVIFGRYLNFRDFKTPELAFWWGMREALLPDLGIVEHLPSANTFEPLVEGRYDTLLETLDRVPRETAMRVLGAMNVAYILEPERDSDDGSIYRSPSVSVYRNPYVLPRAYLTCSARTAGSAEQALSALFSNDFDPAREVVLEQLTPAMAASTPVQPCRIGTATVLLSGPNQVKIKAVLSQPGYLVLTDTFYPGWQALVEGQPIEILRANYAFRAVFLSAGEHEVLFRYRPPCFFVGLACSIAALLGILVAGFRVRALDCSSTQATCGFRPDLD